MTCACRTTSECVGGARCWHGRFGWACRPGPSGPTKAPPFLPIDAPLACLTLLQCLLNTLLLASLLPLRCGCVYELEVDATYNAVSMSALLCGTGKGPGVDEQNGCSVDCELRAWLIGLACTACGAWQGSARPCADAPWTVSANDWAQPAQQGRAGQGRTGQPFSPLARRPTPPHPTSVHAFTSLPAPTWSPYCSHLLPRQCVRHGRL